MINDDVKKFCAKEIELRKINKEYNITKKEVLKEKKLVEKELVDIVRECGVNALKPSDFDIDSRYIAVKVKPKKAVSASFAKDGFVTFLKETFNKVDDDDSNVVSSVSTAIRKTIDESKGDEPVRRQLKDVTNADVRVHFQTNKPRKAFDVVAKSDICTKIGKYKDLDQKYKILLEAQKEAVGDLKHEIEKRKENVISFVETNGSTVDDGKNVKVEVGNEKVDLSFVKRERSKINITSIIEEFEDVFHTAVEEKGIRDGKVLKENCDTISTLVVESVFKTTINSSLRMAVVKEPSSSN